MKFEYIHLLEEMVLTGYVNKKKHESFPYYIYDFSLKCQFEKNWNDATLSARGLILDEEHRVIARPFKKFFNIQELNDVPFHLDFKINEKLDGSLGISYIGEDLNVYVSTRGSFSSEQALHATKILNEKHEVLKEFILNNPEKTFLFEIIYPHNRIVVNYEDLDDIILLGTVDRITSKLNDIDLSPMKDHVKFSKTYDDVDILSLLDQVKDNFEGYVITFSNDFMIKVKLKEYVRLHRIMTNMSNIVIWESLKNGEDIFSLLEGIPDEFYDEVKRVHEHIKNEYDAIMNEAFFHFEKCEKMPSKKDKAMYLNEHAGNIKHVVFSMLNDNNKKTTDIVYKMIKPIHEKL